MSMVICWLSSDKIKMVGDTQRTIDINGTLSYPKEPIEKVYAISKSLICGCTGDAYALQDLSFYVNSCYKKNSSWIPSIDEIVNAICRRFADRKTNFLIAGFDVDGLPKAAICNNNQQPNFVVIKPGDISVFRVLKSPKSTDEMIRGILTGKDDVDQKIATCIEQTSFIDPSVNSNLFGYQVMRSGELITLRRKLL